MAIPSQFSSPAIPIVLGRYGAVYHNVASRCASESPGQMHTVRSIGFLYAAMMVSIAASRHALDWLGEKSPLALLVPLVPVVVLLTNLTGWLVAALSPAASFMPSGYRMLLHKRAMNAES